MLARAKLPHKMVQAFTGRRIVAYEWRPVPAGHEAEAEWLASAGYLELQGQAEEKPEPVTFVKVEPEAVEWLPETAEPETVAAVDLSALTVADLRQIAKDQRILGYRQMSKARLLKALNE